LGQSYVADHKDEARESYLDIFNAIANEFTERKFVLIFDQFESIGKASTDFFLNFAKFILMQDRFHIIVSFRIDDRILADLSERNVFEDLRSNVKRELGGEITELGGLSLQDIGTWIKMDKGKTLPMVPDLLRIREYSGGLPILLDAWIKSSKGLNYEEWIKSSHRMGEKTKDKRDILCEEINKLKENLEDADDKTNLGKLSILQQPLKTHEGYATYLEIKDIEKIPALFEKLAKSRIFDDWMSSDSNSIWFRHELIQKCIEENLGDERRKRFHDKAAKFFLYPQIKNQLESADEIGYRNNGQSINLVSQNDSYSSYVARAYHLHLSGKNAESLAINRDLANDVSAIGDLDLAERCYNRAIDDARQMDSRLDEMSCLFSLTTNVYITWGRFDEALVNFQILLKYYHETNDSQMYSRSLHNIGLIHKKRGEYDQAIEKYNESLEISRELGDQQGIAYTLHNLGMIHNKMGEDDQAIEKYNESLKIKEQIGDQRGIAFTLGNIGVLFFDREEYRNSFQHAIQSYSIFKQIQSPEKEWVQSILFEIRNKLGDNEFQELLNRSGYSFE
jgi:tetratricopeptide (TPR) repeat protein